MWHRLIRALGLVAILIAPAVIWYRQTGPLSVYFTEAVPTGQFIYVLSKLAGMYALWLMSLHVAASLASRLPWTRVDWLRLPHRLAGSVIVLLATTHFLLFFAGVSLRQGHPAWALWLPDFKDYYHTHMSFGVLGLWVLLAVLVAGVARAIRPGRLTAVAHKAYWLTIVLVYLHALAIGGEAQSLAGVFLYVAALAAVLMLLVLQFTRARPRVLQP